MREGPELAALLRTAAALCKGDVRPKGASPTGAAPLVTVRDLGERWTSGELARDYPTT